MLDGRWVANLSFMTHWLLTIVICTALWMLGTITIALGARWLVRTQPD